MSAAPIVALTDTRVRAIAQASPEKNKKHARTCQYGTPALRGIIEINMVRRGIANQSTAQK